MFILFLIHLKRYSLYYIFFYKPCYTTYPYTLFKISMFVPVFNRNTLITPHLFRNFKYLSQKHTRSYIDLDTRHAHNNIRSLSNNQMAALILRAAHYTLYLALSVRCKDKYVEHMFWQYIVSERDGDRERLRNHYVTVRR